MRFAVVKPASKAIEVVSCTDIAEALALARLKPNKVDQRVAVANLNVMTRENALFASPDSQSYFSIATTLYGGNAVIYAYDTEGRTIDVTAVPTISWFNNPAEIEQAIRHGRLRRPGMSATNGKSIWSWPQPRREFMQKMRS